MELDFELVEAYPLPKTKKYEKCYKRKKEAGTCHVLMKSQGIEIKNINYFIFENDSIKIGMPTRKYFLENGDKVDVPTISFLEKEQFHQFKAKLIEELKKIL